MNWNNSSANATDQLRRRLDEVHERLMAVPEVSGVGIGCAEKDSSRLVIQVFVPGERQSVELESRLQQILGTSPYEVVCLIIPDAD